MDATEDFNAIHSKKVRALLAPPRACHAVFGSAHFLSTRSALTQPVLPHGLSGPQALAMLKDYYVGDLVPGGDPVPGSPSSGTATPATTGSSVSLSSADTSASPSAAAKDLVTLNPREKVKLKLTERVEVSHNSRIFRFALPSPQHRLGLPCGRHLLVYAKTAAGETVARAYTPISCDADLGRLDLLIKVGFGCAIVDTFGGAGALLLGVSGCACAARGGPDWVARGAR